MQATDAAPDSKIHGANMGPTCGRQDPDGPHVGPINLAIRGNILQTMGKRVTRCYLNVLRNNFTDVLLPVGTISAIHNVAQWREGHLIRHEQQPLFMPL